MIINVDLLASTAKITKFCKAIILQLKNMLIEKIKYISTPTQVNVKFHNRHFFLSFYYSNMSVAVLSHPIVSDFLQQHGL